jgi:hypothetical protein
MKIVIEIPDWCDERHIRILAGIEMVAYKLAHEDHFMVKTERCSNCGTCCSDLSPRIPHAGPDGVCIHLIPDGPKKMCSLGVDRPFICSVSRDRKGSPEGCTIEYRKV